MSARHTPGPWRFEKEYDEFVIIGRPEWPARRKGVAGEWSVARIDDQSGVEPGEELANARLIATAPELLQALEECIAAMDRIRPADTSQALVRSKAVVAKARGQA